MVNLKDSRRGPQKNTADLSSLWFTVKIEMIKSHFQFTNADDMM